MPELPEVETVVRGLRQPLIGHTIESMWYDWENTIATPTLTNLKHGLWGKKSKRFPDVPNIL